MDLALERKHQLEQELKAEEEPEQPMQKRRRTKDTSPPPNKRKKGEDGSVSVEQQNTYVFEQPRLVSGTRLKDYQLEGVAWMAGLHENGISGILADDMGLGKTLQTIAFSAYLRGRMTAPFLVVCPLSVLYNWMSEFEKFAPDVRMLLFIFL